MEQYHQFQGRAIISPKQGCHYLPGGSVLTAFLPVTPASNPLNSFLSGLERYATFVPGQSDVSLSAVSAPIFREPLNIPA